jgi:hypothetical protein
MKELGKLFAGAIWYPYGSTNSGSPGWLPAAAAQSAAAAAATVLLAAAAAATGHRCCACRLQGLLAPAQGIICCKGDAKHAASSEQAEADPTGPT